MTRFGAALLLATVTLAAAVAPLRAYDLADVLQRMTQAENSFKAIGFDFSQDVRFTEMEGSNTVKGKAVFARPNLMRIEKTFPEQQLTVSNGKTLWVYTPAHKQVWTGKFKSWADSAAVPQGLVPMSGYMADLQKRFDLTLAPTTDGSVRLKAKPKAADVGYALEFQVSTDTWIPSRTTFTSDTAVVVTSLSGVVFDPASARNAFQFKAPAGTDVIPLN